MALQNVTPLPLTSHNSKEWTQCYLGVPVLETCSWNLPEEILTKGYLIDNWKHIIILVTASRSLLVTFHPDTSQSIDMMLYHG